ncbi:MAG: bifunctional precorrin-2 dehydrogenase/sirohydrochlorin ferrochelatase [Nitrospirae bacterium]|nr:bifunctional precorrin-2 dehydrogenase/sirohydrochlorin ferrochelatase [Nitrospirota bacterium]
MDFYPVFVSIKGKKCIVLGGGDVGQRKALTLLEAGAEVTVISPVLTPVLESLKAEGKIHHIARCYEDGDLMEAFIVIDATDDIGLSKTVSKSFGGLLNIAGGGGNFIVPSSFHCGGITFAISTDSVSPALAKTIKEELQDLYGGDFANYLDFLKGFRQKVLTSVSDIAVRHELLRVAGGKDAVNKVRTGEIEQLKEELSLYLKRILPHENHE